MNCDKCQSLLNEFLDDELSRSETIAFKKHLEQCTFCSGLQADFTAILDCCETIYDECELPPNSQALWLRISNLIESEQSTLCVKEPQTAKPVGRWTQAMNRSWQLSLHQMAAGVAGIVVITALVTVVGLQNAQNSANTNAALAQPGVFAQLSSGFGLSKTENKRRVETESRLKEQQIAIDYWNRRVETRKRQWNQHIRDAFERNLREIDGVLAEYEQQLQTNPHDSISEEMMDSALSDKMELLREFSEL